LQSILSLTRDLKMWKLACFIEVEGGITMSLDTILYISDKAISSASVLGALKSTGYEVVSSDGSSQGIALLFLMRSVAAVVLHDQAGERAGFDVARTLRAIRPEVPIILLCCNQIERLPQCVDICVSLARPLEMVTSAVRCLLIAATAACAHSKSSSSCAAA
jgi:CheY-like chemotaxis protein